MYPSGAINAFSIAQIFSSVVLCLLYYGFFHWYIRKLNDTKKKQIQEAKKNVPICDKEKNIFQDMQDFNFKSVLDFFPGFMENLVSIQLNITRLTIYSNLCATITGC